MIPSAVEDLIAQLARFPGIGRRSAERIAFDLLAAPPERAESLVKALSSLGRVGICPDCGFFTEDGVCLVANNRRSPEMLLVVERPMDVIAIEKAGGYAGHYHVLGGHLSPLKGITPDKLRIRELISRIATGAFTELILATSPTVEGDATALYLSGQIERDGLRITRLGRGVPMGGSLEFADAGTLRFAIEGRRGIDGL
jgi:recombination protein RecR